MRRNPALLAIGLSLAIALPATLGCGDSSKGTGPGSQLVGSWNATSFQVPGTDLIADGMSLTMTFTSGGSYTLQFTNAPAGTFCQAGTNCTESGSFTSTASTLTFDPGTVDETTFNYVIQGTTVTVTGVIEGDQVTIVLEKV